MQTKGLFLLFIPKVFNSEIPRRPATLEIGYTFVNNKLNPTYQSQGISFAAGFPPNHHKTLFAILKEKSFRC